MPVKIGDKTYEDHDSAVAALKRSKPGIKDPDAYIATIERAEKGAKKEINHPFDSMTSADKYDLVKRLHGNNAVYVTKINPKYSELSPVTQKLIDAHLGMTDQFNAKQHPFNRLAKERKLELIAKFKGAHYKPYSDDPVYENLDFVSKRGIDDAFNTEKIQIIAAKLQKIAVFQEENRNAGGDHSEETVEEIRKRNKKLIESYKTSKELPFNGEAKADTKKTGADVKKESEKIEKGDSEQFNYAKSESFKESRLSDAIRRAIKEDY